MSNNKKEYENRAMLPCSIKDFIDEGNKATKSHMLTIVRTCSHILSDLFQTYEMYKMSENK